MAFTTVTITQNFDAADGTEPSGTVTFTPTAPMLNAGMVIPAAPVVARLDGGGTITIPLAANTDSGTSPAGLAYQVAENINGVRRSYLIQVPHDQGSSLTLYSMVQLATPPGLSFPGGLGNVDTVTAANSTIVIGGTASNPTVRVGAVAESDVTNLTTDLAAKLAKASNLSDLTSASTARTNLGLGGAATLAVGTTAGTVAAGDDARFTGAATAILGEPSGDTTGATDVAAINAAITAVSSSGGGRVLARAGRTYQIVSSTTRSVLHPSGSTATRNLCIPLPNNVTLDMNGSTLQLRGSSEAILVGNTTLNNTGRNTDLGLVNAVLDGRNIAATSHSMLHFAYCDRLTLDNVKIINGVYQGAWLYDVTNSWFDKLDADTFQGQAWTIGAPQATGSGHNQVYDSVFGDLRATNITLLNTGSQPGNSYNLVLVRCTIDSIYERLASAGIKLQQPSTDVTIGKVVCDTCGEASALNSGMKIQGDTSYPGGTDRPTRIIVGQVVATAQANMGLYLYHTQDCSIGSYAGKGNVTLHTASADVVLAGGINDHIGHVSSRSSNGGGIRISNDAVTGPTGYRINSARITNPGINASSSIRSALRVDYDSEGSIGDLVCIDDQGTHTMSHAINVTDADAIGTVQRFTASGWSTAAVTSNAPAFGNPWDTPNLLTSGEEIFPPDDAQSGTCVTTSQTLRLSYFDCRKSESTTGVRLTSGGTAAAATPTLVRIGLYLIDSTGAGTLVASTANDTALFAASATVYTKSWSVAYNKVRGTRLAVGVLVVSAVATPTLAGKALVSTAEVALAPRKTGSISGQSDLPASFTGASVSSSFSRFYAALA